MHKGFDQRSISDATGESTIARRRLARMSSVLDMSREPSGVGSDGIPPTHGERVWGSKAD